MGLKKFKTSKLPFLKLAFLKFEHFWNIFWTFSKVIGNICIPFVNQTCLWQNPKNKYLTRHQILHTDTMIQSKVRPPASWNYFYVTDKFWDNVLDTGVSFFIETAFYSGFSVKRLFFFFVWTRENTSSTALFGTKMISPYWWPFKHCRGTPTS